MPRPTEVLVLRIGRMLGLALALAACGGTNNSDVDAGVDTDGGASMTDAGSTRPDAGARDAGATDDCAADDTDPAGTVGCNGGFISAAPMANAPFGTCTPDEANPSGTCADATSFCLPGADPMVGVCVPTCELADTYVSTGGCPLGSRCFNLGEGGVCFRDCDDTHACPAGEMCDAEGSCVQSAPPDTDAGMPMDLDAGTPAVDAGTPAVDAGTSAVDAG